MNAIASSGWLIGKRDDPSKEDAMNKMMIAVATATLAVMTLFASAAEAGFKVRIGFGFPIGGFSGHSGGYSGHHHYRKRYYARRKVKQKVHVAKKPSAEKSTVAKVEEAPKPVVDTAESENSSITTAAVAETEEKAADEATEAADKTAEAAVEPAPADEPKTVKKLDCKKFFPSVGMTLTVPCE
jgi:hypothetical protein